MRNLASIQRITQIDDIAGKDRIGLASVLGWHVIVQKKDYNPGDLCVYCEVDSVMPEKPEFEFLRDKKFHIKTMKMAGVISQGICFPLSILPEGEYKEGDDVTDVIGVTKYDPETAAEYQVAEDKQKKKVNAFIRFLYKCPLTNGLAKKLWGNKPQRKSWPEFLQKTDEIRIQVMPGILERKDIKFEVHEKVDGQSGTFFVKRNHGLFQPDYEFGVCSRNLRLFKPDNSSYWTVAYKYAIEEVLSDLMDENPDEEWIAIQGECIAPNVQSNKYDVKEPDLYCFNLIYSTKGRIDSIVAAAVLKDYGLKWVPIIEQEWRLPDTIDEVVAFSHGESKLHKTLREGIVVRNYENNISFKCVDPAFQLQWKI